MTRRICMGQRNGQSGIWISNPGVDVLTASEDQMMMSTNRSAFQVLASGSIGNPSGMTDFDFSVPDQGFVPVVMIGGSWVCSYTFPAAGVLRVRTLGTGVYPPLVNIVHWAVTNQRIHH